MTRDREILIREAEAVKGTESEIEGLIPVQASIKKNADVVYSLRFTRDEMTLLRKVAKERDIKVSELIRSGALAAAQESGIDEVAIIPRRTLDDIASIGRQLASRLDDARRKAGWR